MAEFRSENDLISFARLSIACMAYPQSSLVAVLPVSSLLIKVFKASDASARRALFGIGVLIESKKSRSSSLPPWREERALDAIYPVQWSPTGLLGSSACTFQLRPIDSLRLKFLRPPGEPSPALGALLWRRGGIPDLVNCICCEFLSAQPPIWIAAGPRWRFHGEPKLDQSAGCF
jgi:hypothetical protein